MISIKTALKLGRVSNLPTVWSNCIAGAALSAAPVLDWRLGLLIIALSASYIGGMFLNDAFDAKIDARERSERPIPAGEVSRQVVFIWGFLLLLISILLLLAIGLWGAAPVYWMPPAAGLVLAGLIVLYNMWHKANPISPFIMGLCRVAVYATAALVYAASLLTSQLILGALMLLCHLIGLTYIAKQENLGSVKNLWPLLFLFAPLVLGLVLMLQESLAIGPYLLILGAWIVYALYFVKRRSAGDIPRAVVSLIAGISLLDAMLVAWTGQHALAILCLVAFGVTLFLQRYIAGT